MEDSPMSDKPVITNPHVSSVHAAVLSKKIAAAHTPRELEAAAAEHSPYLVGNDKENLRQEYRHRLAQVGHRA
jgi:hypothetical protein